MRYLYLFMAMVVPFTAEAVVLNNSNAGVQTGAQVSTSFGKRVSSATPSVDVQVDTGGNIITTTAAESEVAKQFMLELTTPILKTGIPSTVSPNTTQQCQSYDPANAAAAMSSGIPLMGKVFLCNHSSQTGYYNKVFNQAMASYAAAPTTVTGDATVPASVYSVPNQSYTGYNDLVDSTLNAGGGFTTVSSGVQNGGTLDYAATRLLPLISKEFDYMTVKLPNYAADWANQMNNAQQQFQGELNTLLGTLGVSATSPLPANFSTTVNAALATQYNQVDAYANAATAAAANGATAGTAAGTAGAAGNGTTATTTLASLAGITVPAAQQATLDAVTLNLGTAITQMAIYNDNNTLYTAQNTIYANNLTAYNTENAKVSTPDTIVINSNFGGAYNYEIISAVPSIRVYGTNWKGQSLTLNLKILTPGWSSAPIHTVSEDLVFKSNPVLKTASQILAGSVLYEYSGGCFPSSSRTSCRGKQKSVAYTAGNPGPDAALLAQYKTAYQAASTNMTTYKAARDAALLASSQAFATAQSSLSALQIALTNVANNSPGLIDQYTQSAQTNLTNTGTGGTSATALTALDSLMQGLGGMISMANNVTNALVNTVTQADINNASTTLVKAFKASMGVGGTLALGDGLATDAEITTFSAQGGAPTGGQAGVGLGVVAAPIASSSQMRLNGLRDTPYRILKEVKAAIETLRTAMTMVAVATQGGGMTLQSYAPSPDVQPVTISSTDSNGGVITGNLKVLGNKIKTALNI